MHCGDVVNGCVCAGDEEMVTARQPWRCGAGRVRVVYCVARGHAAVRLACSGARRAGWCCVGCRCRSDAHTFDQAGRLAGGCRCCRRRRRRWQRCRLNAPHKNAMHSAAGVCARRVACWLSVSGRRCAAASRVESLLHLHDCVRMQRQHCAQPSRTGPWAVSRQRGVEVQSLSPCGVPVAAQAACVTHAARSGQHC